MNVELDSAPQDSPEGRWRPLAIVTIVVIAAAMLRVPAALRSSLWADEFFSLAVATGHSVEQPAAVSTPAEDDYIQTGTPRPASEFRRYAEHDSDGPRRVIRAVFLSDTSPPLYYLLLWIWTRIGGTSDFALRSFSLLCALLTVPVLWSTAVRIGSRRMAVVACALYAVSPLAIYYGTEGRMYSLAWLLAVALARVTLAVRHAPSASRLALWSVIAALGLLTHYYVAFVVAACGVWLLSHPPSFGNGEGDASPLASSRYFLALFAAALLAATLVLPWYVHLGASLHNWRITAGWLKWDGETSRGESAFLAPWTLLDPDGSWGEFPTLATTAAIIFGFVLVAYIWRRRADVFKGGTQLLWLWLAFVCAGPFIFDLANGTQTVFVVRYFLAGLPAVLLLLAAAISELVPSTRAAVIGTILVAAVWVLPICSILTLTSRIHEPFAEVARILDRTRADVIIVHSIPSGVIGIARYIDPHRPLVSWVGQLDQLHVPRDIAKIAAGRRVAVVEIHKVGAPHTETDWLRSHAVSLGTTKVQSAVISVFAPR